MEKISDTASTAKFVPWKSGRFYNKKLQDILIFLNLRDDSPIYSDIERRLLEENDLGKEIKTVDFYKIKLADLFPELREEEVSWFSYEASLKKAKEYGFETLSITSAVQLFLECTKDNRKERWKKGETLFVPTDELIKNGDLKYILEFKTYDGVNLNLGGMLFGKGSDEASKKGKLYAGTRLVFQKTIK
jgi:hypothetical protein